MPLLDHSDMSVFSVVFLKSMHIQDTMFT